MYGLFFKSIAADVIPTINSFVYKFSDAIFNPFKFGGISSRIRHSNAITGTMPLGLIVTVYVNKVLYDVEYKPVMESSLRFLEWNFNDTLTFQSLQISLDVKGLP